MRQENKIDLNMISTIEKKSKQNKKTKEKTMMKMKDVTRYWKTNSWESIRKESIIKKDLKKWMRKIWINLWDSDEKNI